MSTPELRQLQSRKAYLTRYKGASHPDTIRAGRELAAAQLAAAVTAARAAGLDRIDVLAVVEHGRLPAEAAA